MNRRGEDWLARDELIRRAVEAGLCEADVSTLLFAFEAGVLRSYAATLRKVGKVDHAESLENWARGVRPIGWLKLLPEAGERRG